MVKEKVRAEESFPQAGEKTANYRGADFKFKEEKRQTGNLLQAFSHRKREKEGRKGNPKRAS